MKANCYTDGNVMFVRHYSTYDMFAAYSYRY